MPHRACRPQEPCQSSRKLLVRQTPKHRQLSRQICRVRATSPTNEANKSMRSKKYNVLLASFFFTAFHSAAYFSQLAKFALSLFVNTVEFSVACILTAWALCFSNRFCIDFACLLFLTLSFSTQPLSPRFPDVRTSLHSPVAPLCNRSSGTLANTRTDCPCQLHL